MMRQFPSLEAARRAFDEYAAIEPRLTELWHLCRRAAPPARVREDGDDTFDRDAFDRDALSAGDPDEGWCAEDFFFQKVKSRLLLLVGMHRTSGPPELRSSKAYDLVYAALFDHALNRSCACCGEVEEVRYEGATVHG